MSEIDFAIEKESEPKTHYVTGNWKDSVMEYERPCCFEEYCDDEESWEALGMRIKWTEPPVPGELEQPMLEPLPLKLCLECKKPIPLRDVSAWAWTHMYHKDNAEGIYREIRLPYDEKSRKWDDWGVTTYIFKTTIHPAHPELYRLTFNVKFRDCMIWANVFQTDSMVTITPGRERNVWTTMANFSQITHNMYIGNSVALLLAEEHGFDAVLNLHQELMSDGKSRIVSFYKSTTVATGAANDIPPDKIQDIITWMRQSNPKYRKILVGDREGLGRAGSIMVAYIFANNRNLTFEEAFAYVRARRAPIYCHKGLRDTLYNLYPRD